MVEVTRGESSVREGPFLFCNSNSISGDDDDKKKMYSIKKHNCLESEEWKCSMEWKGWVSNIRMSVHRWFNKRDLDAGRCSSCTKARAIEKKYDTKLKNIYIEREGLQKKTHKRSERYVQMMHTCWIFLISRCFFLCKKTTERTERGTKEQHRQLIFSNTFFLYILYIYSPWRVCEIDITANSKRCRETTKGE